MYSNNSYTPLVYKKKIVKAFLNQRAVGGVRTLQNCTEKRINNTQLWQNDIRKLQTPLKLPKKFQNTTNHLVL